MFADVSLWNLYGIYRLRNIHYTKPKCKNMRIFYSFVFLSGLYPWTSIMSHNCTANTKITTRDDFSYVCESTVGIAQGQEIVTDYHHYHYQLYGTSYRRNDLKSTWSFDCLCHRQVCIRIA